MSATCAHPVVAATIGILLGLSLAVVSRFASRLVTPANPTMGFVRVAAAAGFRTIVTFGAMLLFFTYAPDGFLSFAVAAIVTFILSLAYEAYRASYSLSSRQVG